MSTCAHCGREINDHEEAVDLSLPGNLVPFCHSRCQRDWLDAHSEQLEEAGVDLDQVEGYEPPKP